MSDDESTETAAASILRPAPSVAQDAAAVDVPDLLEQHAADAAAPELIAGDRGRHAKGGKPRQKGFLGAIKELPVLVLLALVLALLIKTFLVQAFFIPSPSMVPTLEVGDRVLVNKLAYKFGEPQRGDVVVFLNPNRAAEPDRNPIAGVVHWLGQGLGIGQPSDEDFIKRVIGLPGETVKVTAEGVWIDGVRLEEPYIASNGGTTGTWDIPEDHVFVMGDNRPNSSDARVFGPIATDSIVGKAFVRIWPIGRWGGL